MDTLSPCRSGTRLVKSASEAWGRHSTEVLTVACWPLVSMILRASRTWVTGRKNSYIMQMWKSPKAFLLWFWATRLTSASGRCLQKKLKPGAGTTATILTLKRVRKMPRMSQQPLRKQFEECLLPRIGQIPWFRQTRSVCTESPSPARLAVEVREVASAT